MNVPIELVAKFEIAGVGVKKSMKIPDSFLIEESGKERLNQAIKNFFASFERSSRDLLKEKLN